MWFTLHSHLWGIKEWLFGGFFRVIKCINVIIWGSLVYPKKLILNQYISTCIIQTSLDVKTIRIIYYFYLILINVLVAQIIIWLDSNFDICYTEGEFRQPNIWISMDYLKINITSTTFPWIKLKILNSFFPLRMEFLLFHLSCIFILKIWNMAKLMGILSLL